MQEGEMGFQMDDFKLQASEREVLSFPIFLLS